MNDPGPAPACPHCGTLHESPTCPAARPPAAPVDPRIDPRSPSRSSDPLIGAMIGSFRIERLLGRGGMGTVYLGIHPIIGSRVAIKFLHESMCSSPDLVARFYDEARSVNLIGHENIVAIFDLALLPPDRYFIVMEYLDGAPLSAFLRKGQIPHGVAIDVFLQLADALRAAHERGVVHRDLKPENVFLLKRHGSSHFVKLVDFGIAKLADRRADISTGAGILVGTPEYMAPEQCEKGIADARTDVYALGIMAYELATGRLPFTGENVTQIILAQLKETPRPPREIDPAIPAAYEAVILKAISKDARDRYQNMKELAGGLAAAQRAIATSRTTQSPSPVSLSRSDPELTRGPELEVRGPGGLRERVRISEVTRGGLFLVGARELPPLFSRVDLRIPAPVQGQGVELTGEVVRHVTPEEAARWNMEPGYAVQFGALSPAQRAALERLAAALTPRPAVGAGVSRPGTGVESITLGALQRRAAMGPYELLGVKPDASFPEIRERSRTVRRQLEALSPRLSPEQMASSIPSLVAQLDAAVTLLGTASERLMYDARHGNFRGVAQCLAAGLSHSVVEARRRMLLSERPANEEKAERHRARAEVARKLGNVTASLAEYAVALTADPLDLELHQAYWDLLRSSDG